MKTFLLIGALGIASLCPPSRAATPSRNYYGPDINQKWGIYTGRYVRTLYYVVLEGKPASRQKHKEVLREIIDTSVKKHQRVPPGIYCEYACLLLREGALEETERYFALEIQAYPESAKFVHLVRQSFKP